MINHFDKSLQPYEYDLFSLTLKNNLKYFGSVVKINKNVSVLEQVNKHISENLDLKDDESSYFRVLEFGVNSNIKNS